ncbi:MAG: GAF domain-containing protein [Labilithrix sp.]|nr:GAF domain-containing protein [Labilithrix sp.]
MGETAPNKNEAETAADGARSEADAYTRGMEHLVGIVQALSLARTLQSVQAIVRSAARALTGADGATFVLRDGDSSFYADEDAIGPLWKGKRFPLETCISGWVIQHREAVVIEDIFLDDRIPHDAYRATFVKSLVMAPIRREDPLGAIGAYWADRRLPTQAEVKLLQALADSTSIALENVQLYAGLEERVRARTAELEAINAELEAFAYSVSHDLRTPLRVIQGFAQAVAEDADDVLDDEAKGHLRRVTGAAVRMDGLIDALLDLSRVSRAPLARTSVDVTALARELSVELAERDPTREVVFVIEEGLVADADPALLRAALDNLMNNAWKFTSKKAAARIEVGASPVALGAPLELFVRDDGVGFDALRAPQLFAPFHRLCGADFPGTGIGLATVRRIVRRHGGDIRAESAPERGATFSFTLQPRA